MTAGLHLFELSVPNKMQVFSPYVNKPDSILRGVKRQHEAGTMPITKGYNLHL